MTQRSKVKYLENVYVGLFLSFSRLKLPFVAKIHPRVNGGRSGWALVATANALAVGFMALRTTGQAAKPSH